MSIEIEQTKYNSLQNAYKFAKKIKQMQTPLTKPEITDLRKLIKKHIEDGYTNYLRLISIYSVDRDEYLGIYVNYLYTSLKQLDDSS